MRSFLETLRRDREISEQQFHIKFSSTETLALENINRELKQWTVKSECVQEVLDVYHTHGLSYVVQYVKHYNLCA